MIESKGWLLKNIGAHFFLLATIFSTFWASDFGKTKQLESNFSASYWKTQATFLPNTLFFKFSAKNSKKPKQLHSNFQPHFCSKHKQLEPRQKNGVANKKSVYAQERLEMGIKMAMAYCWNACDNKEDGGKKSRNLAKVICQAIILQLKIHWIFQSIVYCSYNCSPVKI